MASMHMIEVDEATATQLRQRADALGMSVAELVAYMTALAEIPVEISPRDLADLDRQWAAIESGDRRRSPMIRSHAGLRPGARRISSHSR